MIIVIVIIVITMTIIIIITIIIVIITTIIILFLIYLLLLYRCYLCLSYDVMVVDILLSWCYYAILCLMCRAAGSPGLQSSRQPECST